MRTFWGMVRNQLCYPSGLPLKKKKKKQCLKDLEYIYYTKAALIKSNKTHPATIWWTKTT